MIIVVKMVLNNSRFFHSTKRYYSLKGISHVIQFEGVATSYFDLCADNRLWPLSSLNFFPIIFELVSFSRNLFRLNENWLIFGTIDWYLQEPCLSHWVSQTLRKIVLFLALAVANFIFFPLMIFWTACAPTFANLSAYSF